MPEHARRPRRARMHLAVRRSPSPLAGRPVFYGFSGIFYPTGSRPTESTIMQRGSTNSPWSPGRSGFDPPCPEFTGSMIEEINSTAPCPHTAHHPRGPGLALASVRLSCRLSCRARSLVVSRGEQPARQQIRYIVGWLAGWLAGQLGSKVHERESLDETGILAVCVYSTMAMPT